MTFNLHGTDAKNAFQPANAVTGLGGREAPKLGHVLWVGVGGERGWVVHIKLICKPYPQ